MIFNGNYIAPFKPVANITPFTYRDGMTYLEVLEDMRKYVNDTLVAFVNENFTELGDKFEVEINRIIDEVETRLTEHDTAIADVLELQNQGVDVKIDTITTLVNGINANVTQELINFTSFVNDAVDSILNSSVDVAESVIVSIINDSGSSARVLLDATYAAKSIQDIVESGRLSSAVLNGVYAAKSIQTLVETGRLSVAELGSAFAAKSLVDSGRLSATSLDSTYAAKSIQTQVETGRLSESSLNSSYAPVNLSDTYANRPAASSVPAGSIYYSTDIPEMYRSNGSVWTVVGSGGNELASASLAPGTPKVVTTAKADIAGLTATFVAGERPVELRFMGDVNNNTAGAVTVIYFVVDGVDIQSTSWSPPTANKGQTIYAGARNTVALTPGQTYTAKLMAATSAGAGAVGSQFTPTTFQVVTL